jgi:hypothetical protein
MNRRVATDGFIERLFTLSVTFPPEDQTVAAMAISLVLIVQHMPWARPLRHALVATTGNALSDLATNMEIVNDTLDIIAVHAASVLSVPLLPTSQPASVNRHSATCSELFQTTQST